MADPYQICPSILAADFSRLGEEVREAAAQGADWIHLDVMDGHFVPNLTMGPVIVEAVARVTDLPLEVHLMIENPDRYLGHFARAGARRQIVHVETCPHLHRTLQSIHDLGCEAGVAINPGTPADAVRPVLSLTDLVLVMTVNPGFAGQSFLQEVLPKVGRLRGWIEAVARDVEIEVDGGVSADTLPLAYQAGARVFVAASAVFRHPDGIAAGMQALRDSIPEKKNGPRLSP